jgi:hypothetical protein
MNPERRYLMEMRRQAARHLPPDFSSQVVRDARLYQRRSARNRLTLITTALCIAAVLAAHWIVKARADRQNLEQWSKAAQQIAALEQTI